MPEAEKYYLKSLDIYEQLSKSNPQQFEPYLGFNLINMGLFYQKQQNYPQAENYMVRALAIYEKWTKIAPSVFDDNRKKMRRDVKALYEEMLAAARNAQDKAAIEQKLKALLAREWLFLKNYCAILEKDFDTLDQADLATKQLAKARKWVGEWQS